VRAADRISWGNMRQGTPEETCTGVAIWAGCLRVERIGRSGGGEVRVADGLG